MHSEVTQDVIDSYRAANYVVCDGAEQFTLRVDEHSPALEALYRRTKQSSALFVTAFNPEGQQQDQDANASAQEELLRDLSAATRDVFAGIGEDPEGTWPGEPSCLALGLDQATSQDLGRRYRQNAVVWADSDATPSLVVLR